MAQEIKRVRYFDGLYLKEEEFKLDQDYHIRMRRLHNRHLHGYGIVWGLAVENGGSTGAVVIRPGMAIDKSYDTQFSEEVGREIVVVGDTPLDLSAQSGDVYVWVRFNEAPADIVPDRGGTEPIHIVGTAVIEFATTPPATEDLPWKLILAKVTVSGGAVTEIDDSPRILLGSGGGTVINTGGGLKNYILNPDAELSQANWASAPSTQLTVARSDTAGTILAGGFSFVITATASVDAGTDYVTALMDDIDEEDKNQLLAIEFSYKGLTAWDATRLQVIIRDTTNNVDIIPNPAYVPAGQGKYRAIFTTTDSPTYQLRFVAAVSDTAFSVAIDSVRVGPGDLGVGTAISDWQQYTMNITATTTAPTKATSPNIDKAMWRRVGDSMEIVYTYYAVSATGSSAGSGTYLFSIPAGFTIDSTKISISTTESIGLCGNCTFYAFGTSQNFGSCKVYDTGRLMLALDLTAGGGNPISSTTAAINNANMVYSFRATVPIAEWNTGTVSSFNRVEYAYNSTTTNADDTSAFAYGEGGGLVPTVSSTFKKKRVRLSRKFKHVRLEIQEAGSGQWVHVSDIGYINQEVGGLIYGIWMQRITDTDYDLWFMKDGIYQSGLGTTSWSTLNSAGTRWRVVGCDNPLFVETAPRQYLAATSTTKTPSATGHWHALAGNSVILTPGEWMLNGGVEFLSSGGSASWTSAEIKWSLANGADSASEPANLTVIAGLPKFRWLLSSSDTNQFPAPAVRFKTATAVTVYLDTFGVLTIPANGRITTYIYAERMS